MAARYPNAWAYLKRNESQLRDRERDDDNGARPFDDDEWYRFGRNQNLGLHAEPKLAVPRLVTRLAAAIDSAGQFSLDNVDVGGILVPTESDLYWCSAMFNSRTLDFVFRQQENTFRGGFRTANRQFISPLPIPPIDRDPALALRILGLAHDLHRLKETQRATDIHDTGTIASLQRQFEDADRELEPLVADAYGLSEPERTLVFGG